MIDPTTHDLRPGDRVRVQYPHHAVSAEYRGPSTIPGCARVWIRTGSRPIADIAECHISLIHITPLPNDGDLERALAAQDTRDRDASRRLEVPAELRGLTEQQVTDGERQFRDGEWATADALRAELRRTRRDAILFGLGLVLLAATLWCLAVVLS